MSAVNESLVVFIKNPRLGKVKTRLARVIGNEKALEVYLKLLRHTRRCCAVLPYEKAVSYSDCIDDDTWKAAGFTQLVQPPGNLGARMLHTFRQQHKDYSKVVIIGSDCPDLKPDTISRAFDALSEKEVVIGPAADGGYYLIGMRRDIVCDPLFENIEWSTGLVYEQTVEKLEALGYKYEILEVLRDLDTYEDLKSIEWLSEFRL